MFGRIGVVLVVVRGGGFESEGLNGGVYGWFPEGREVGCCTMAGKDFRRYNPSSGRFRCCA